MLRARLSTTPGPCVLDVCEETVQTYAQGSMPLVTTDLAAGLNAAALANASEVLQSHGLLRAFALRRELVNFKKVVLHTFVDSTLQEKELRKLCCFFFADHHFERLAGDDDNIGPEGEPAFVHSARYDSVCVALADCRAARQALNDARDFCKALCSVPRHPAIEWSAKLQALPSPEGMSVSRYAGGTKAKSSVPADATAASDLPAASSSSPPEAASPSPSERALSAVLQSAEASGMSAEEVAFLRCVLIARGGAKALGLREGVSAYAKALDSVVASLRRAASVSEEEAVAEAATRAAVAEAAASGTNSTAHAMGDALRPVLRAEKQRLECTAAAEVCSQVSLWLHRLMLDAGSEHAGRLFDASDRAKGARSVASFTPSGFELGAHLRKNGEVARRLSPQMRAEMLKAGWPPPEGCTLRGCLHGSLRCSGCRVGYSPLWVDRGVCFLCEEARRDQGLCPFRTACKGRAFCKHTNRCLACEDISCERGCRLVRGDGEAVALLVSRLAATSLRLLLLDFDRTLASSEYLAHSQLSESRQPCGACTRPFTALALILIAVL